MRAADAMWLHDTPQNLMIINAVLITEQLTADDFRRVFEEKILSVDGGLRYDRFKKRVVYRHGSPHWELDPDFDLNNHIVAMPFSLQSEAELQAYIGQEAAKPLPDARSRWQMQIIESYGQKSAILIRIHHVLADGIALVPVMFSLIDEARAEDRPSNVAKAKGHFFARFVLAPLLAIPILLRRLFWIPDKSALHGPKLTGIKHVSWTPDLDLAEVKAVKNHFKSTINDVLMSCISGGMRRYLQSKKEPVPAKIRTSMPFNIRSLDEPIKMENKFAIALVELPLVEGVRNQLAAIKRKMDAVKRSVQPLVLFRTVDVVLWLFPPKISGFILNLFGNKCSTVTTNVPGPQGILHIAGRKVHSFIFWVPTRATIGIGISILSISGKVRIGIIADEAVLPQPHQFVDAFMQEFEEMKAMIE